jgi:proline-specific peptidase
VFININGVRLAYDDTGGTKTAIVTLHGAPGMGSRAGDWDTYTAFSNRYRIVSYDQRGSGESEGKPPYSHDQFCADLEALRLQLNLGKIILAGGSYGGMIALEYALRHPDNLHALILRDTAASNRFKRVALEKALASPYPMDREKLERLFTGRTYNNDDFRELIKMIMPLYTVSHDPERDAKAVANMIIRHETHNWAFSRNQPSYDIVSELHRINVPVLVTVGRHDWITPLEASEELVRELPKAELVIFENSGHSPQKEERERWLRIVREFLEKHVPAGA